jgi:heptosyltransferase III
MSKPTLNPRNPSSLLPNLPRGASVLVIRLRSIGDVVLTTPALAALHAWRPDLRISVLLARFCMPLLEGNPAVAEVLEWRGFWPTVRELRRGKFAIAYNMHGGPASALLTGFSGARARVCWTGRQYSFLYNVHAPDESRARAMHTVEQRFQQLYWTGLPAGPIPASYLYPQEEAIEYVQRRLSQKGVAPGQRYAVLRPGASGAQKLWSVEGFAAIARWLREERGLVPIVNLGPADQGLADEVRKRLDPVSVRIDSLDLRQLTALLAGASLFVGNDTGPTHMAAALGRPCVVVFGNTPEAVWGPWKTEYRVVENAYPCDQCPEKAQGGCRGFGPSNCIQFVTADQVRAACASLLDAVAQRTSVG